MAAVEETIISDQESDSKKRNTEETEDVENYDVENDAKRAKTDELADDDDNDESENGTKELEVFTEYIVLCSISGLMFISYQPILRY